MSKDSKAILQNKEEANTGDSITDKIAQKEFGSGAHGVPDMSTNVGKSINSFKGGFSDLLNTTNTENTTAIIGEIKISNFEY